MCSIVNSTSGTQVASFTLSEVLRKAREQHRTFLRNLRPEVSESTQLDILQALIRQDETMADWVNRNRPAVAPAVFGEPQESPDDQSWFWEVGGWSIHVHVDQKGQLSPCWAKIGGEYWYYMEPWGERRIEGGDWEKIN